MVVDQATGDDTYDRLRHQVKYILGFPELDDRELDYAINAVLHKYGICIVDITDRNFESIVRSTVYYVREL